MSPQAAAVLADLVLVAHVAFVLFVIAGGLAVVRWPWLAWIHLPAAAWGAFIEFAGWICPLTPLENALRLRAGRDAYAGDFVSRYLLPVIYPEGLTREVQMALGAVVVAVNAATYFVAIRRRRRLQRSADRL
jgi:hypothetical protein